MTEKPQQTPTDSSDKTPSRGFFQDVVLNAIEPGINNSVLLFLNIVFILLLLTLFLISLIVGLNIHLVFLAILSLGLMVAFNWFIAQLPPVTDSQQPSIAADSNSRPGDVSSRQKQE